MEIMTIQFSDPMLYDRLHTLSAEYSLSADVLISLAVKRLLDDVEVIRDLRSGKVSAFTFIMEYAMRAVTQMI